MVKKKRELTEENVFTYINDLAGIRVICLFLDDIYRVRDFIYQIPGISIVKEKDFVKKPKNSGYQSLHVIVQFTDCLLYTSNTETGKDVCVWQWIRKQISESVL